MTPADATRCMLKNTMIRKNSGYAFDGKVRSVFQNSRGDYRMVVESLAIPLLLHIFSPDQFEPAYRAQSIPARVEQSSHG